MQRQVNALPFAGGGVLEIPQDGFAEHLFVGVFPVNEHPSLIDGVQPVPVLVLVGGVDHHQVEVLPAAVDHDVINDVGIGVQQVGIG